MLSQVEVERMTTDQLDAAFEQYADRVDVYGVEWWARDRDPQRARLARVPTLRAQLAHELEFTPAPVSTRRLYRDSQWDDDRRAWQASELQLARTPAGAGDCAPNAFVALGLPGSGKTSALRRIASAFAAAGGPGSSAGDVAFDPDELRSRFPEFEHGLGSLIVQEELQRLCYDDPDDPLGEAGPSAIEGVARMPRGGATLFFDTVGQVDTTRRLLEQLDAAGWSVFLLLSELPLDLALLRAKRRALTAGRLVELEYIVRVGDRPRRTYEACAGIAAVRGHAVVDTSGPFGTAPRIVAGDAGETFGAPGETVAFW